MRQTPRTLLSVVVAAGVLAGVFFALPAGGSGQAVSFAVAAVLPPGLLGWRLQREGLFVTRPWVYLQAGTGLYAVSTASRALVPLVTGRDLPSPSVLDVGYLTSYVLYAAFLTSLTYRRSDHTVRSAAVALIDAGLLALAVFAILGPTLLGPSVAVPETVGLELWSAVGYPLLTAVLVGVVARVTLSGRQRSTARSLLLVWIGGVLAGDGLHSYLGAGGSSVPNHAVASLWLLSYAALGALALHPGLDRLRPAEGSAPLEGWRLAVPLGAVLIPAGVSLVDDDPMLDVVVAIGIVLLLTRAWRLSGDLAEQRRLTADLSELSRQFEHQSLHDPLTGLANRSLFTEQLRHAGATHERHGRGLALLIVDLDGFKAVNDRYGHQTGDQVLTEVAHRLELCTRVSDTLARVGGDEFALVLPGTDLREARTIADRIHEQLAAPVLVNGRPLAVTASIGIARPTSRSLDLDVLVRQADAAMYTVKATGSGRTEVYRSRSPGPGS